MGCLLCSPGSTSCAAGSRCLLQEDLGGISSCHASHQRGQCVMSGPKRSTYPVGGVGETLQLQCQHGDGGLQDWRLRIGSHGREGTDGRLLTRGTFCARHSHCGVCSRGGLGQFQTVGEDR
eukprot:symbB.v1.2.011870.t1/scaffold805.1/size161038/4